MFTIEDAMGFILFLLGLILIIIAFLAAINVAQAIHGFGIAGFSLFGFILCVTGFAMARSAVGGMFGRFRGY
jgi:hypothetical protein